MQKDVVITYETLFEILRLEKNREDLQKIDERFYEDVLFYLSEKKAMLQNISDPSKLLFTDDRVRLELENVRKILKDLYDRREKKILNLALNRSRTGMTIANISHMLPSEKALFYSVCQTLTGFRDGVLGNVVAGKLPDVEAINHNSGRAEVEHLFIPTEAGANVQTGAKIDTNEQNCQTEGKSAPLQDSVPFSQSSVASSESLENQSTKCATGRTTVLSSNETKDLKSTSFLAGSLASQPATKTVRFLAPIEEIVGPDLQIYGPYTPGEQISLPKELAWVFIEKKQAEEI